MPELPERRRLHPRLDVFLRHRWTIMLFDGSCMLCNGGVVFVGKRSIRARLAFCPMQSEPGRAVVRHLDNPLLTRQESFAVIDETGVRVRSNAVIRVMHHMQAPWPFVARCLALVPCPIRDACYGVVARNRHRMSARGECRAGVDASIARKLIA